MSIGFKDFFNGLLDVGGPVTVTDSTHPFDTDGSVQIGQQIYFLGFPSGLGTLGKFAAPAGVDKLPFIKSGILSALDTRNHDAVVIYIDGQNNPGFSGGPIVFRYESKLKVLGVVSGYRFESKPVVKKKDLLDPNAPAHDDLYTRDSA